MFTGTAEEFFNIVHPEDREKIRAALSRTVEQDLPYEPTYRVVWPDNSVRYISSRGRLVRDDKGQPARIHGILWDITDQHLLERERIRVQKLESVGTLAGGIAHDFNNLLQGIFGYISLAKMNGFDKTFIRACHVGFEHFLSRIGGNKHHYGTVARLTQILQERCAFRFGQLHINQHQRWTHETCSLKCVRNIRFADLQFLWLKRGSQMAAVFGWSEMISTVWRGTVSMSVVEATIIFSTFHI